MRNKRRMGFFIAVVSFIFFACGSTNSSIELAEPDNKNASNSEDSNEDIDLQESNGLLESYQVGDTIDVDDHQIALISVDIQNGLLIANFLVKNGGSDELSLSSLLSFEARDDSGTRLDQEIFDCSPGLDGSLVPGDFISGKICWSGASYPAKIYYDPSLFGSGTVIWKVNESVSSDVNFSDNDDGLIISSYFVGDIIEVDEHIISLTSIEINNGIAKVDFAIKNESSKELSISSLISFEARDSSGLSLEQEIFDCSSGMDGSVVSGDLIQGAICWTGATFPLKIYYDPSLFGSGTVVWDIKESNSVQINLTADQITSYSIGDIIETQDHNITLVETVINNGNLNATFLIENTGETEINISSLLSFDARENSGFNLEQEIFNCSSSLDGTIVSGDKLKGSICWTGASFPIKIYYDLSLFGSGTVVWIINE